MNVGILFIVLPLDHYALPQGSVKFY